MKTISRTVLLLSLVSLFTDMASEMLYPVMPMYLKSIGFSVLLIGILEGCAEVTASVSKGYFGNLSDTLGKRAPFVQLGYTLSALSKPMMAVLPVPFWVFISRTFDRLGKGIRTGARDAMLSAEATATTKGAVFGFHRAMDTLGAALGPLVALIFLLLHPGSYTTLFLIAVVPGLIAIATTFQLKDRPIVEQRSSSRPGFFSFFGYWKQAPSAYRTLIIGLLAFALCNSSDLFLLLMVRQQGVSDTGVITVYIFYNLVYALAAWPAGILGDKFGLRRMFLAGLVLFAIVYGGMALSPSLPVIYVLFFLYALYAAGTEGISKAWIATLLPNREMGTAVGLYTSLNSLCVFVASAAAGLLWEQFGPAATFAVTVVGTLVVIAYFLVAGVRGQTG